MWPEFAFFKPAQQFGVRVADQPGVARGIRAPVKPDQVNIFYQQNVGRDLGNASGGEADNNDAPAPRDGAQTGVKSVAAYGIIDHVGAAAARDGLYPLANVLARIV